MRLKLKEAAELHTIRAALQFYLDEEQGDPSNRSDRVHDLATDNDNDVSYDDGAIYDLLRRLKKIEWVEE